MLNESLRRNCKRKIGDSRPFFSYVKQKTKIKPSIGLLKHGGTTVTSNEEMATLLNKCFGDVFTREDTANIPEPVAMYPGGLLEDIINISVSAVKRKSED